MPYRFIEESVTADVAFEAWGASMEETFSGAAAALLATMLPEGASLNDGVRKETEVASESAEMLLFDFLQELVFFKDAESLLLRPEKIGISEAGDGMALNAVLVGEEIDPERHDLVVDVKAVTLHDFSLERSADGWRARVILDV